MRVSQVRRAALARWTREPSRMWPKPRGSRSRLNWDKQHMVRVGRTQIGGRTRTQPSQAHGNKDIQAKVRKLLLRASDPGLTQLRGGPCSQRRKAPGAERTGGRGRLRCSGLSHKDLPNCALSEDFQESNFISWAPQGLAEGDETQHLCASCQLGYLSTGRGLIKIRTEFALRRYISFPWAVVQVESWPAQPVGPGFTSKSHIPITLLLQTTLPLAFFCRPSHHLVPARDPAIYW